MIRFTLPYPPSVNHYWQHTKVGKHYIGAMGNKYHEDAWLAIKEQRVRCVKGEVSVSIVVHAPDKRVRDLDNVGKALFDVLVINGIIESDGGRHLRKIELEWGEPKPRAGELVVTIAPWHGTHAEDER